GNHFSLVRRSRGGLVGVPAVFSSGRLARLSLRAFAGTTAHFENTGLAPRSASCSELARAADSAEGFLEADGPGASCDTYLVGPRAHGGPAVLFALRDKPAPASMDGEREKGQQRLSLLRAFECRLAAWAAELPHVGRAA